MKLLLLLVTLSFTDALAEGWYCAEVASEWLERGKILQACGIGKGADENTARLDAFNNARKEFELVCNKDTTCSNRVINIEPQRSDCIFKANGFICNRLFYYHISDLERRPTVQEEPKQEVKQITNIYYTIKQEVRVMNSDNKKTEAPYRTLIRTSGRVNVYSTNSRQYQGSYLVNPTPEELESAIRRGNQGSITAIYILNK